MICTCFINKSLTCLISGFGPFGNHAVNASWVAVQELAQMGIANDVDLITAEIPVEYDTVRNGVPDLWNKYKPRVHSDYVLLNCFPSSY